MWLSYVVEFDVESSTNIPILLPVVTWNLFRICVWQEMGGFDRAG